MGRTALILVVAAACGGGGHHTGGNDAPGGTGDGGGDGSGSAVTWSVMLPADSEWQALDVNRAQGKLVLFGQLLPSAPGYPAGRLLELSTLTGATVLDAPEALLSPTALALDDSDGVYLAVTAYDWEIVKLSSVDGRHGWGQSRVGTYDMCGTHAVSLHVDAGVVYGAGFDNHQSCSSGNYDEEWLVEARDASTGNQLWEQTYNPPNQAISDYDTATQVLSDAGSIYVMGTSETLGWILQQRSKTNGSLGWQATTIAKDAWSSGTFASVALDATGVYASLSSTPADYTGWSLHKRSLTDGSSLWEADHTTPPPQPGALLFKGELLLATAGQPIERHATATGMLVATSNETVASDASLVSDGDALYMIERPSSGAWTISRLGPP
jgi:hypothetical protein